MSQARAAAYTIRPHESTGPVTRAEMRAALAAPAPWEGFSSGWHRTATEWLHIRHRAATVSGGTPCLLLHGLAVSHRYLMPTARALRGRAVYVPDLAGFGLSGDPGAVLDVGGHAGVLIDWLDAAGIGPVAVLGNSFGCQVAVELAARRPDLVAALILVGPTTDPAAASMLGQLRRLLWDLPFEDPRQARIVARDVRDAGLRRVVTTLRHAVRDPMSRKLATLRQPVLLARGDRDRIATQPWLDHLAALLPAASTLVLPGAAHNAVTTAGPALAAAVEGFIADVP